MKKAIIIPIILSSLFFVLPKVASAATNLGFNLNHQNLVVGQTFTADIIAKSSNTAFNSANFEISFNRALIDLTTVEISAGSLLGCSNGTVAWSDPYNLETGTIMAQVFRSGCSPLSVTSSTTLVRLNFTAIGAGATSLAFTDVSYYEETLISTSSSSVITVIALDAVNPSLTISTASGSTDTSPAAITGMVSDNVEVTQVAWSNDLGDSGQATITDGNWTFDAPLQVGDNDITVTATDTSSNTSSDTITITYAPEQAVVSLSPAVQNVNIGGNFTVTLRVGNVTDLDNLNVNINFDSTKLSYINFDLPQNMADSGWDVFTDYCYDEEFNPISSCINILASANFDLPQAINGSANIAVLNFTANAIGSNQFTFDEILSVLYATGSFDPMLTTWNPATATIVDGTAPQITITSPISNPTYSTATTLITIGGTASDNIGLTSVTWVSDRGRYGSAATATDWSTSVNLSSGDNIITFTARDAAGNIATDTITVNRTVVLSSEKAMTTFNFNALSPAVTGSINEAAHTVALTVPYGTAVTALVPTITITGATVNPTSGTARNFTSPVTYTVTAADSSIQAYTVTVTVSANPDIALVAADKAALVDNSIRGANSALSNITVALTNPLPATGANGSTITWVSNNTSVVSNNGQTVNRPAFASGNATVTLTATITKGVVSDTKVFTLTVIKQAASAVATITSATYTVGATTITNVPFATSKATFLAALTKGEANQTWNNTGLTDPAVSGNTLVVTAQNSTTIVTYTITVAGSPAKAMTVFNFNALSPAVTGSINEAAHTVALTVPFGTNITSLTPTITITGATVNPTSGTARNFTSPVTYTVTAANGSTQAYVVTVTVAANSDLAAVAADQAALVDNSIKGANTALSNIIVALTNPLPAAGANGSTISWVSNNPSVVSSNGQTVNRPAFVNGNATVTLTATITKGVVSDTKVFTLTVIKQAASAVATVTSATYTVGATTITNVPFTTSKATFLAALTKGETNQTWNSSNIADPVVTGNTLVVSAQDGTTAITYTVTVTVVAPPPDNIAPVVTAFSIPSTGNNLTISITSFTATDDVAVSGYKITESSIAPLANDLGWSVSAPTSYTFTTAGSKILYAFSKNSAGYVSTSLSATIVVDNTAPSMPTGLSAIANSSSQISLSWTASSDNIGVTGYNIFRNSTTTTAIATTTGTSFSESGLSPATQYTYYIRSFDAVDNTSEFSAGVSATTENAAPPSSSNSSSSSSGSATLYCSSVTYRDWGSCLNGFQYRIASSSLPIGCSLTTAQQIDSSRTCVASALEVLSVKIYNPEASANVALTQLEQIQVDAATTYNNNKFVALNSITKELYINLRKKKPQDLTDQDKYAIAYYIHNDTPTTAELGAGERAGVLNSYLSVFGKLPDSENEWQDVIKIANGRWPSERNTTAETKAKESFKKIYGREANVSNTNDNAAVTVMAYGLRPSQRNLNSEKAAILSFKYFMKRAPTSASDWDMVRAIVYSGAKR